jgi:hypothetical protein
VAVISGSSHVIVRMRVAVVEESLKGCSPFQVWSQPQVVSRWRSQSARRRWSGS